MSGFYRNVVATFVRSIVGGSAESYTLLRPIPQSIYTSVVFAGAGEGPSILDVTPFLLSPRTTSLLLNVRMRIDAAAGAHALSVNVNQPAVMNRTISAYRDQNLAFERHTTLLIPLSALKTFEHTWTWTAGIAGLRAFEIVGEIIG